MDALVDLTHSSQEHFQLQALREIFDWLLGKVPVFVDTHTKVDDFPSLYLAALRRVNGCLDQPANNDVDKPLEPDISQ